MTLTRPRALAADAFWLLFAVASAVSLWASVGRTFPGFTIGLHAQIELTDRAGWTGPHAGLKPFDRIVAVNGEPAARIQALVEGAPAGTVFHYELSDGRAVDVPSMPFTPTDAAWNLLPFWLAGVCHLLLGRLVARWRPSSSAAHAHARYCEAMGAFCLATAFAVTAPWIDWGVCVVTALLPLCVAGLALEFPRPLARGRRAVTWTARVLATLGVTLLGVAALDARWVTPAFQVVVGSASASVLALLALWARLALSKRLPPDRRAQVRVVWLGLIVSLVPSIAASVLGATMPALHDVDLSNVSLCVFPLSVAYAIMRHRLLDIPRLLRRGTVAALLVALLAALYAAVGMLGNGVLARALALPEGPSAAGFLATLAVAVAFWPLHRALAGAVERWFGGARPDPLDALGRLGERAPASEVALAHDLVGLVRQTLSASWVELWRGGVRLAGVGTPGDGAFEVLVEPADSAPATLKVGPRDDESPYHEEERRLLDVLAVQAARALERTALQEAREAADDAERRARTLAEERASLLSQVVHDLGTDLTNMAVAVELARELPEDEQPWGSIARSLARIEQFLDDKRRRLAEPDASRRGSARVALERAIAALEPAIASRNQRLDLSWQATRDAVPLTEVELEQVFRNVLENASKFSPAGEPIALDAANDGPALVVAIRDRGPGIPAAGAGSGLGLRNVRSLLESVGGRPSWANAERGAIVTLRLPLVDT